MRKRALIHCYNLIRGTAYLEGEGKQIEHGPHQHVSARNRREFCITASCRLEVAR